MNENVQSKEMDRNIQDLIEHGRKEMYNNKNYDVAEEMFVRAKKMLPRFETGYVDVLLKICAEKRAEHDQNLLLNSESKITKSEQGDDNVEGIDNNNSVRGGREAIHDKSSRHENMTENISYVEKINTVTAEYGRKDSKHNMNCPQAQHQENINFEENYDEKKVKQQHEIKDLKEIDQYDKKKSTDDKNLYLKDKHKPTKYEEKAIQTSTEISSRSDERNVDVNPQKEDGNELATNAQVSFDCSILSGKEKEKKEVEMLLNSFNLRAYVLQIGIKAFASKPNYRTDIDFEKVSHDINDLILRARNAYLRENEVSCNYYISEAEKKYCDVAIVLPEASISKHAQVKPKHNQNINNTEDSAKKSVVNPEPNIKSVSYKEFVKGDDIDVVKCLKLAETALIAEDFKKAERLIKKADRICPTKNARELYNKLETAKKAKELAAKEAEEKAAKEAEERAAKEAEEKAAKEAKERAAKEAELAAIEAEKRAAQKTVELPAIKTTEYSLEKSKIHYNTSALTRANEAQKDFFYNKAPVECYVDMAQKAINEEDYNKAAMFLTEAKRSYPEGDFGCLDEKIKIAIASRSSTVGVMGDENVQLTTNEKKRNSKKYVKIARCYLEISDIAQAEINLFKAREYYNGNDVNELFSVIENLKKSGNNSRDIPSPSFVNSYSENKFAMYPDKEETPYHVASTDKDSTEECLKKGRYALTNKQFDKAEEYATKCVKEAPVRAQGLLYDVKINRRLSQETMTLRSGRSLNTNSENEPGFASQKEGHSYNPNENLNNAEALKTFTQDREKLDLNEFGRLKPQPECRVSAHIELCQSHQLNDRICSAGPNIESNKEAYNDSIEKAKQAMFENDYSTAERLLRKAYRMNPNKELESIMDKIKNETKDTREISSTSLNPDQNIENSLYSNQLELKKCIKLAEDAFVQGDLDKAERLFTKAYRMNASQTIKDSLEKVRQAQKKKLIEEDKEANKSSDEDVLAANKLNNLAVDAMNSIKYFTAGKYLTIANIIYLNNTTTQLLKDVGENIQKLMENVPNEQLQKELNAEKQKQMKIEANKCLNMAKKMLEENDINNAQLFAILSDIFYKNDYARQLFKDIFVRKYESQTNTRVTKKVKKDQSYICFKSERYIEIAEIAFKYGEFYLAQEYLVESKNIYHSHKAQVMLAEVKEAIEHRTVVQDQASVNRRRGVFGWFIETFF